MRRAREEIAPRAAPSAVLLDGTDAAREAVLLRIAKTRDVRELTPYGRKACRQGVVEEQRASIVERLGVRVGG